MKRVSVVVNKWWEADAVVGALLNDRVRPATVAWPAAINHPRARPIQAPLPSEHMYPQPRLVFDLTRVSVAVWCLSDVLEHLPDKGRFQSSSQQKAAQLSKLFNHPPDVVVAVGTAAHPGAENGRVMVGTQVFMHNFHANHPNPDSDWTGGIFDQVTSSALSESTFTALTTLDPMLSSRFLVPPNSPAAAGFQCVYRGTSLGTVNVTDYGEYAIADAATVHAFNATACPDPVLSVETTHGLIRSMSPAPFMFISGIVNRLGEFDREVRPNEYAQNQAAAHNAGVLLAAMLPTLDSGVM